MNITLPTIQAKTINSVVRGAFDMENMTTNVERLEQYVHEIEESNPEIVSYITRASKMISLVQRMEMDCGWFALVSMILMFKAVECEYVKFVAKTKLKYIVLSVQGG